MLFLSNLPSILCLSFLFQAVMEEIAGFEDRLASLKEKGDNLVSCCSEQIQAKISQQIQAHQQGTKDSYSAICSTAQRVSITTHSIFYPQYYSFVFIF